MPAPHRQGMALGWTPSQPTVSTFQINAAATWLALSFIPDSTRTLSAVRSYVSAVAGMLAGTDITVDLYDSTGALGVPGSAIESGKLPSATITAAGWYDFTGFTTALTAGTMYWIVFKNVNATPATNNCTFRFSSACVPNFLIGNQTNRFSWTGVTSTNSGSAWTILSGRVLNRVSYADGTYDGTPISNSAIAAIGDGVYSTRESGVKFTYSGNAILQVSGLSLFLASPLGLPTGNIRFGLWTGSTPTLKSYTNTIPGTMLVTNGAWMYSYFPTVQEIRPGDIVRITLGETTNSDTSAKYFRLSEVTWDADSNSLAMLPWQGTTVKTYFDGSTWTDTQGTLFAHALLLDNAQPFGVSGAPSFGIAGPLFKGVL